MNIKSFSCSADSARTIIIAAKLAQLDKKAISMEYFNKLCLAIGREFVNAIAGDPNGVAFIEAKTSAFIERQKKNNQLTDEITLMCNHVAQASMMMDSDVIDGKKHQEKVARLLAQALALAKLTGTTDKMLMQIIWEELIMEKKEIEIYRIAEKTPKDDERVMVYRENGYEWRPQSYNDECKCWDTSDGDDYEHDVAENDRWFSIEEL